MPLPARVVFARYERFACARAALVRARAVTNLVLHSAELDRPTFAHSPRQTLSAIAEREGLFDARTVLVRVDDERALVFRVDEVGRLLTLAVGRGHHDLIAARDDLGAGRERVGLILHEHVDALGARSAPMAVEAGRSGMFASHEAEQEKSEERLEITHAQGPEGREQCTRPFGRMKHGLPLRYRFKPVTAQVLEDPFALVGTVLDGQYRVDAVIGEGGFGVVYKGWHHSLAQPVAIKVLKVLAAIDDPRTQEVIYAKFRDEARLLYTLSQGSLHIVRSMDFGAATTASGMWAPFMVLEWLDGHSLEDDLAERRQSGLTGRTIEEALALLAPAAEGLSVAHHQRVAHRDIKPANFFLLRATDGPQLKVLDFGIAKMIRDEDVGGTRGTLASFTWLYAAPEQLDPRLGATGLATDVYAFALVLSEVLSDRAPGEGHDVLSLMKAATDPHVRPTPRQRGARVTDAVEQVCRRALDVDPKVRFATISEFWAAITQAAKTVQTTAEIPSKQVRTAGLPARPMTQAVPSAPLPSSSNPAPRYGTPAPHPSPLISGPQVPPYNRHTPTPQSPHQQPFHPPPPPQMPTFVAPRRTMPSPGGSQAPIIIAVVAFVLALLFAGSCAILHAAC